MREIPVVPTEHYMERCVQRAIPADAAAVLLRFGRSVGPGHTPDREIFELAPAQPAPGLTPYVGVRVVLAERRVAVTAFRRRPPRQRAA